MLWRAQPARELKCQVRVTGEPPCSPAANERRQNGVLWSNRSIQSPSPSDGKLRVRRRGERHDPRPRNWRKRYSCSTCAVATLLRLTVYVRTLAN